MSGNRWPRCVLATAILISGTSAPAALPPGLVVHLDFDQIEGGRVPNNIADAAPDGVVKEARFVAVENFGQAFFGRQDDEWSQYVEVADHATLNAGAFTVSAWVCPRRLDIGGSIACKHDWLDGGARGFTLRTNFQNKLNFTVGAGGWISVSSDSFLQANTWVHAAGTFDGETLRVYFNGILEVSTKIPDNYNPSPYPMRVGHGAYGREKHRKFDGKIDDLIFWNRCLTPEELDAVYLASREGRPKPPTPDQIGALITKLAADEFRERQAARKAIIDLGPSVIPVLEEHIKSPDAEVLKSARILIGRLAAEK